MGEGGGGEVGGRFFFYFERLADVILVVCRSELYYPLSEKYNLMVLLRNTGIRDMKCRIICDISQFDTFCCHFFTNVQFSERKMRLCAKT